MKKRVIAKAQKRHKRNKQKYVSANGVISKALDFLRQTDYPEHSLYRRY